MLPSFIPKSFRTTLWCSFRKEEIPEERKTCRTPYHTIPSIVYQVLTRRVLLKELREIYAEQRSYPSLSCFAFPLKHSNEVMYNREPLL